MGKFLIYDGKNSFGAPEIAAALAIQSGISGTEPCLLVHLGSNGEGADQGFLAQGKSDLHRESFFMDEGMDALFRLAESGRLNGDNIQDYTLPLLKGRLDLAVGHNRSIQLSLSVKMRIYKQIWHYTGLKYNRTFVQGSEWMIQQCNAGQEDKRIILLPQHKRILDAYFYEVSRAGESTKAPEIIVLFPYDEKSVLSVKNINRMYGLRTPVIGIPHCTDYQNAWNCGDTLSFMVRNQRSSKKKQSNASFMNAIRRLSALCSEIPMREKLLLMEEETG